MSTIIAGFAVLVLTSLPLLAQEPEVVMRPVISEEVAPVRAIAPVAEDGHVGEGFLRKPPGDGPFPAVVLIHGGGPRRPTDQIRGYATGPHPSRFLEHGYVVTAITRRGPDPDLGWTAALEDAVAAVDYLKALPYVDAASVLVNGCSTGGNLTLEVAAATQVAAIASEEPTSPIMMDVFTDEDYRARGEWPELEEYRAMVADHRPFKEKVARISSPVLILLGEPAARLNPLNAEILVPELRAAEKSVEVMTYPGEPHCFSFYSSPPRTPNPGAALQAFQDIDAFFREHIATQPTPMDPALVEHVPVEVGGQGRGGSGGRGGN